MQEAEKLGDNSNYSLTSLENKEADGRTRAFSESEI